MIRITGIKLIQLHTCTLNQICVQCLLRVNVAHQESNLSSMTLQYCFFSLDLMPVFCNWLPSLCMHLLMCQGGGRKARMEWLAQAHGIWAA